MANNSGFLITDQGLAASSVASPGGPYIHIASYKLGSSSNYAPTRGQTALQGTVLYTGIPNAYTIHDANTIEIDLIVGPDVGPFDFGEIGLFLENGTLFATCVFDTLQNKQKALGPTAGNTYKLRSFIRLQQIAATCYVTVIHGLMILEVPNFQSLSPPGLQIGGANAAIIHDNNDSGNPVFVVRDTDTSWGLDDYARIVQGTIGDAGSSSTQTTVTHPNIGAYNFNTPCTTTRYVMQNANGELRKVILVEGSVATLEFGYGLPVAGAFEIFEAFDHYSGGDIVWAGRSEYNDLANLFNPYWSTPNGLAYPANKGWNQAALPVLTVKPQPQDWYSLINAVYNFGVITGTDLTGLVNDDFVYHRNNSAGSGMYQTSKNFQALVDVTNRDINRKDFAVDVYQEFQVPTGGTNTYNGNFDSAQFTYFFTEYFPGDPNLKFALFNAGHTIRVNSTVSNGVSPAWAASKALLASIGTIIIGRSATVSSTGFANQTGTGNGWYNIGTTYETIYQCAAPCTGGGYVYVTLGGFHNPDYPNVYNLAFSVSRSFGGGADSSTADTLTTNIQVNRPNTTWVHAPALPFPTLQTQFQKSPELTTAPPPPSPTPAPAPPAPSPPAPAPAPSGNANYDTPGTYTFTVPAGVTTIYTGTTGGGGGGGGGGYGTGGEHSSAGAGAGSGFYSNPGAIAVTQGEVLNIVVGSGGFGGGPTYSRAGVGSGSGGAGGPSGIQRAGAYITYADGGAAGVGGHEDTPIAGGYGFQTGGYGNPTYGQYSAKVAGGNGGISAYGSAGVGGTYNANGTAGTAGGGGGGGGVSEDNPQDAASSGGRGGDGFVHISWGNAVQPGPNVAAPGYPALPGINGASPSAITVTPSNTVILAYQQPTPMTPISVSVAGGFPPYTYQWSGANTTFYPPNAASTQFVATQGTFLTCHVSDSSSPPRTGDTVQILVTIQEFQGGEGGG